MLLTILSFLFQIKRSKAKWYWIITLSIKGAFVTFCYSQILNLIMIIITGDKLQRSWNKTLLTTQTVRLRSWTMSISEGFPIWRRNKFTHNHSTSKSITNNRYVHINFRINWVRRSYKCSIARTILSSFKIAVVLNHFKNWFCYTPW